MTVEDRIRAVLGEVELDSLGEARAEIALTLARKLDQASTDHSGPMAMSLAGISKELRAVLDSILEQTAQNDDFIAGLYASVGDS